ncbi:unnamed protein product [Lathyrus sativus]|nr:unnamed protein product [Lathyrus sativus]
MQSPQKTWHRIQQGQSTKRSSVQNKSQRTSLRRLLFVDFSSSTLSQFLRFCLNQVCESVSPFIFLFSTEITVQEPRLTSAES